MEIKAKAKHVRMSPRKVRLVADVVRGLETNRALNQLGFINKGAALPVKKLIKSAIANAEHNYELDKNNLYIKEIRVDEGKVLHRWQPKAHGRATPIRKKMSHIILTLGEIKDGGEREAKKREIEAPINLEETLKKATKGSKDAKAKEEKKVKNSIKSTVDDKKGFTNKMFRRKSGQ